MGPRCYLRGNKHSAERNMPSISSLQWGHGSSYAETRAAYQNQATGACHRLQWGHGFSSAQTTNLVNGLRGQTLHPEESVIGSYYDNIDKKDVPVSITVVRKSRLPHISFDGFKFEALIAMAKERWLKQIAAHQSFNSLSVSFGVRTRVCFGSFLRFFTLE
jgi:hypothetical protein